MVKNYVLDTNVLIHDPNAIFSFEDNNVIIPLPVLEELDKLKKESGSVGKSARDVIRKIDELRRKGSLQKGIQLENGGILRVHVVKGNVDTPRFLHERYMDNWILAYTLDVKRKSNIPTFLVTKDINLRIKADSLGIPAQDYLTDRSDMEKIHKGYVEIENEDLKKELLKNGKVEIQLDIPPNTYVDLGGVYGRYRSGKLIRIFEREAFGIKPRNREQVFSMDSLLDDEIDLVTLIGVAGTGKTLLALACGLKKVLEERVYERIIVTRPTIPVGRDIGYLPGDIETKMKPWLQPIMDNLELIAKIKGLNIKELRKRGILEIEVLSYIRGRSIPGQYMIIDEAQNLTPHEVKTILTRVGEGTKVVLIGDPYQIDTPYLDMHTNGLVYVSSKFVGDDRASTVFLTKGERSHLATRAAKLL